MAPEVLERVTTPRGEIQIQRRGDHYEIIENGVFLMATYNGESERRLVTAALDAAATPHRVLIGGLGVGFSLAAALADGRVEQVTVVEVEEPVIGWNRRYLPAFNQNALADPRTRIIHADLVEWLKGASELFDAICLDIDNGPEWTVTEENQGLYGDDGLAQIKRLLAPDGCVAYWSAHRAPAFMAHLQGSFRHVEERPVALERGEPDYVYIAR